MKRREFITLLGASAAWPPMVRAQQPATPVIGFLDFGLYPPSSRVFAAFRQGLADTGYISGQNVVIEYRSANFDPALLPRLAADLVARQVAVIVTAGSQYAARAAKAATSTIPIVFSMADDPVKYGLVASYSRPGGNITGMNFLTSELSGKQLNLLVDLVPQATRIGYLSAPSNPVVEDMRSDILAAGHSLAREIIVLEVRGFDFEAAFATLAEQRPSALIVGNFTFFVNQMDKILELAARYKVPAIYPNRLFAVRGGLMSYSGDALTGWRQVLGGYVGRILKGEKPADLPVQQPTTFDFVINLKTAKILGIDIPPILLVSANEVIE
jgi:putative ABC transport system substrate-binding protein